MPERVEVAVRTEVRASTEDIKDVVAKVGKLDIDNIAKPARVELRDLVESSAGTVIDLDKVVQKAPARNRDEIIPNIEPANRHPGEVFSRYKGRVSDPPAPAT